MYCGVDKTLIFDFCLNILLMKEKLIYLFQCYLVQASTNLSTSWIVLLVIWAKPKWSFAKLGTIFGQTRWVTSTVSRVLSLGSIQFHQQGLGSSVTNYILAYNMTACMGFLKASGNLQSTTSALGSIKFNLSSQFNRTQWQNSLHCLL